MKVMLPQILHLLPVEASLDVEGIGSSRTNYQIMPKNTNNKREKEERRQNYSNLHVNRKFGRNGIYKFENNCI
jgi:hypothetical protein